MHLSKKLFFAFFCLLSIQFSLSAQNISYVNPTFFGVCETAEFQIQITNDTGAPLQNTEVLIGLPTGVEYDSGAACQSTNLSAPIFCLGTIPLGETQTITFQARALCDAISTIDAGQLFCNSIILTHDNGTTSINPDCYEIDKPLLVFTNVSNTFQTGTKGQILQRTITILNTLGGPLSEFTFTDAYQEGIVVSTDLGTVISSANNTLEVLLDGADFSQIGDGDEFFEQTDGALVITEFIEVTACGIGQPLNAISNISASYGCFGATCQQEEAVAYVNFGPSTAAPNLRYEAIVDSPSCFCGNEAVPQMLKIVNEGNEEATDISIEIDDAGMHTESFAVELGGTTNPLNPSFGGQTQYVDCNLTLPLAGFATINIPELPAGDSLFILWDAYFCSFNECQEPRNSWFYKVDYFKGCPPPENLFIEMDEPILASDSTSFIPTEITLEESVPDNILTDGEELTLNYSIDAEQLSGTEGTFHLNIEIPCDFLVDDLQSFVACGQEPTLTNESTDSTVIYQLVYDLPLECDFSIPLDLQFICSESCGENFCKDTLITSCTDILLCMIEIPPTAIVSYVASFDTPSCARECGPKICSDRTINKDCPPVSYCENIIPGYLDYDYDLYRVNSGQGDSNNDHLPDGAIDWDLANRYHAMTGDTLRSELRGEVRVDVPGSTFNYGRVDLNMGADGLFFMINNGLFDKETGTVPVSATLRIFDQSTNSYYDCDEPTLLPDPFFGYDISVNDLLSNNCAIPLNFQYSQGDSIILLSEYKIEYNLLPQDAPLPPVVNLNFEPEVFLYNEANPDDDDLFTCGCTKYGVQVTGYNYRIQEGSFGLRPCEDADYGGGYLFRFELGEPNFFPFEYRPLGALTDWDLQMPANISITESKITFLRYQDGTDIAVEEIITPDFLDNTYSFDLQDYQMPMLDEGYIFLFQHQFENDCDLTGNFPLLTTAEINFAPSLPELENPALLISQSSALRMQLPALVLDTLITCDVSFDNKNRWTLNISNESDLATQNVSLNTWIRPISESGGLTNFEVIDVSTGLPFPNTNGIFQIGNLNPTSSLGIQITANNQSCETENVILEYGWNCAEYNDPNTEPCFAEMIPLKGISPPGEIALDEDNPMQTLDLCDLSPFFEVDIFNADLGAICHPNLEIILPNGFAIEPGTTEISYPMGAPFTPVGDPDLSTANLAEWQISNLIPDIADNCLPGVTATPQNGFTLRFKARTDCNFPSGSRLRFFTKGEQNCGDASNISTELSEEIFISGADAPYTTSFNSPIQNLAVGCQNTETILVSFNSSAATLPGDSIYIFLPTDVQYVPDSYQVVSNASLTEPSISSSANGIILQSEIPMGENQIIFQFDITGLSALTCDAKFINIQTISHADALCLTNNESCTVPVVTGDLNVQLIFNRPIFELSNLQINTSSDNSVTYNLQVDNSGTDTDQPTLIDFYADGSIIHTHSIEESIGSTNITGDFVLPTNLLCDLTVLIDPATNCACETDELTNASSIDYELTFSETVCSGETLELGIPGSTGSTYQWSTPTAFLDCPTCPTTDFSFVNQNQNDAFLSFNLTENNGNGCIINYSEFEIMIPAQTGILSAETEICLGDCATIIASEADNYQWSCGTVDDPAAQVQTVCPTATTTYCVAITDEFGCVGEEEVIVEVQALPIANAGADVSFCPEDLAQLQAQTGEDYVYLWEPVTAVEDAAVANPILTTTDAITLTLTVFANGCQGSDEINITFGEVPDVEVTTNVETICGNSFAQLTATGADIYEWLPSPDLSCLDCPNPQATPDALTTFYVLGTNAAGCFAIDSVTIDVSPDQIVTTLAPEVICAGEEYEFFGEMLTTTGEYCEAFVLPMGCDSLVCLNLTVLEEIETEIQEETFCEGGSVVFEGMLFEETTEFCITFQTVNGCDSTRCLNLTVSPALTLEITLDTTILVGESLQLNATEGYASYNWTPETGLSCTDCANPIATPDTTTTYQVTVMDTNGCERSAETTVTITTDCDLEAVEVPNVFTPNGDELNDAFRLAPNSKLLEVTQFEIYSRWGQLLYSNTGFDVFWDGEFNGVPSPADAYVYIIKAKCEGDDKVKEFLGEVTLVR